MPVFLVGQQQLDDVVLCGHFPLDRVRLRFVLPFHEQLLNLLLEHLNLLLLGGMLGVAAHGEPLAVGVTGQGHNLLEHFLEVDSGGRSDGHLLERRDAHNELLHLGHRVGVAHADVYIDGHLALEHVVRDAVHAELLELLALLAGQLENSLVRLVVLLQ